MEDKQLVLSSKQTLASADSTNTLNLIHAFNGSCGHLALIGHGIGAGVTSVTVTIKDSADGVTFASRESVAFTDIKALNKGYSSIALSKPLRKFVKVSYVVAGTATGEISAFITDSVARQNVYPASSGRDGNPY